MSDRYVSVERLGHFVALDGVLNTIFNAPLCGQGAPIGRHRSLGCQLRRLGQIAAAERVVRECLVARAIQHEASRSTASPLRGACR